MTLDELIARAKKHLKISAWVIVVEKTLSNLQRGWRN